MKKFRLFVLVSFLLVGAGLLRATTVIPPTFDELVSQAEVIFQGAVTNVHSQWTGEGKQRHIVTYVTFRVDDQIKGVAGTSYVMRMLGGTVDGETMEVTDGPKFAVRDRDILFVVQNGKQFIPLVGIMNGRFRIERDSVSGVDLMKTNGGEPVTDLAQLGGGAQTLAGPKPVMSLDQFKAAIRANLSRSP